MSPVNQINPEKGDSSPPTLSGLDKTDSSEKPALQNVEDVSPTLSDEESQQQGQVGSRRLLALTAMAFLWTGSQIPLYLFGAIPPYIYADIGGADRWTWMTLANILALAAVCPFVGSLSDLFGRRYIAIIGASLVLLGMIIASTAQTMNVVIGGQVFAGAGAGINELTALAAASEIAPVSQRGKYVGALVFTITPFCISALYAQLIAAYSSWRYVGLLCGLWNFIGLVMTAAFYFPPPRIDPNGLSRREIVKRMDLVGGFLSIVGLILFIFIILFVIWEARFAKFPMFPKRINKSPRILVLTLIITFVSGANFISLIAFWPTQAYNVYGHDPVQVGVRALPIGVSLMVGAVVGLVLLSVFKGANRTIMVVSSVLMTAGCGAMSIGRVDNMYQLWGILVLAGLGIGGIVVPASIITMIICPDDLIATVAALTLSIRVIGGSIGYSIYYNIFLSKFTPYATEYIGGTLVEGGITSIPIITEVIELTGAALPDQIKLIPGIAGNDALYEAVIKAGQMAYSASYRYVYLASIAWGCVSIVASLFLGDINAFMDDHVAVVL
ncbi:hypothetical protein N0V93_005158 [Gnomoniopsis smithogilvyi]|uniref:Major facilitator superfamily (MFS) profile domain-containing protein n=1 Tax=Gnomoniopsis smithogilvyi TaxID=1191159 RepID=A0A9W8YV20_9PEZI|nr:hypothetical protein N0V93_005158 [Gnomoniopsis smithogilvyi]